ncbi:putative glycerophosphoryl diester phosphodiesterase 1 [Pirellula sp. SH-Sr6A]|uniref:glycerophosphodiester phosphodiesterase n=1 Tax=Pirellula sp. SH-Sr6A TaxID=1632865 RepID=UPI00078E7921|nr:glycerophosphodiester phosphodiesterase [Pirellula sp. SH-Sr6A]AMV33013.1 putative glycerophosphoryl diester phosphodiesterase 1 [Pirellula sp. SH-Sr6A]
MIRKVLLLSLVALATTALQADAQMIVGHRGASFDAPENTMSAFRLAFEQQADGVEGDFYYTKDKQIVCIHDKTTLRTTGEDLDVSKSTLAELRKLEYGSWKDEKFQGEPIPTFAEVLQSIPADKKFIIELKTGPAIVPLLQAELKKYPTDPKKLLIICFNADTVIACKKFLPDIKVHWLTGYKQNEKTGEWKPQLAEVVETLRRTQADGLGTQGNRDIVTKDFIAALRNEGLREFHVWTVDVPEDAIYFQKLGAMGITTNRPDLIRKTLNK